jgi:hypothetical protein
MDVHASPDELPPLQEFLGSLQVRCRRPEAAETLERSSPGCSRSCPTNTVIPSLKPSPARANSACKSSSRTCRRWDQYQGQLWPGFHRHAATVMLAYGLLVWWELRQRTASRSRGRPRHPFSPRPDRRRATLPAVHRQVAQWLRHQAVQWWVTTDRFMERCSLWI